MVAEPVKGRASGVELHKASSLPDVQSYNRRSRHATWDSITHPSGVAPFIGRLGGNQQFVLNRDDPQYERFLQQAPDAAPHMTLREQLDCRPFKNIGLWKAAVIEGMGTLLLVYISSWSAISPAVLPAPPDPQWGSFDNATFVGPLVGAVINFLLLTLFTISFGAVTGAHLNPTITIATFCARLCSLPRLVLYVAFQTAGGALAGLLLRASYGAQGFKVGGCWLFPEVVPVRDAFVIELFSCLTLLFLAFGVGLDPRQKQVIAPSLAPFLVGLTLAALSFGTAFSRFGFGGASMNPARCFGAAVGSVIPTWHWYQWIADIVACIVHGVFYLVIPPGQDISGMNSGL